MSDSTVLSLMLITIASSTYTIFFPFSLFRHERALGCLAAGNYRMRPQPWPFLATTHRLSKPFISEKACSQNLLSTRHAEEQLFGHLTVQSN